MFVIISMSDDFSPYSLIEKNLFYVLDINYPFLHEFIYSTIIK